MWLTAQEYETDKIADDSDEEKRIARAERQAERLKIYGIFSDSKFCSL